MHRKPTTTHGEVYEVPGHVCSCLHSKCRPSLQGQRHKLTPSVRSSDRLQMFLLNYYFLSVKQGYECGGSQKLIKFTTKRNVLFLNWKTIFSLGGLSLLPHGKLKSKILINHLICKQCTVNWTSRCTVICLHSLPDSSCRSLPINTMNKNKHEFTSMKL